MNRTMAKRNRREATRRGQSTWIASAAFALVMFTRIVPSVAQPHGRLDCKTGTSAVRVDRPRDQSLTPCTIDDGVVLQAQELLSRLRPTAAQYLEYVAHRWELERALRVQQALFREDLISQRQGFTDRQLDVMVFVVVALSVDRADARAIELETLLAEGEDSQAKRRRASVNLYRSQALTMLSGLAPHLRNIPDRELRFRGPPIPKKH